jgi:uncharacterized protein YodC (DUF2158 family)
MEAKFKIGDIVRLKSGGVEMTVNKIIKHNSQDDIFSITFHGYYECCYSDDNLKKVDCLKLHEDTLVLITK